MQRHLTNESVPYQTVSAPMQRFWTRSFPEPERRCIKVVGGQGLGRAVLLVVDYLLQDVLIICA